MGEQGFARSVGSVADLGPGCHACWPFDDGNELGNSTVAFLTEGSRLGERLMYVGGAPVEDLRAGLAAFPQADSLMRGGALDVVSLGSVYPVGRPLDVQAQVATYAAATDRALADGYAGLRVLADVTELARDYGSWEALTQWEGAADRYIESHAVTALCCYDRRMVPEWLLCDIACAHPIVRDTTTVPFRLIAQGDGLALHGEVDYFAADAFGRLLRLLGPQDDFELDLSGLEFIDHHGVLTLAQHAGRLAEGGRRLSLRGTPRSMQRTSEILGIAL